MESLNCLKKGVVNLTNEINKPENAEGKEDLLSQLCQAYCSIAEMYTTDLWYIVMDGNGAYAVVSLRRQKESANPVYRNRCH